MSFRRSENSQSLRGNRSINRTEQGVSTVSTLRKRISVRDTRIFSRELDRLRLYISKRLTAILSVRLPGIWASPRTVGVVAVVAHQVFIPVGDIVHQQPQPL